MFWNFKNVKQEDGSNLIELRIEGEIIDDGDAWIYDWFGEPHASPSAFRNQLAEHKGKDITVWIDSPGGSVWAGAAIYNALKEHDGKVIAKIDSMAFSAASVIAMSADEIHMSPTSMMMIHNPLGGAWGEAKDLRKVADILDTVKETIVNAYVLKTGLDADAIWDLMSDETWMSANKAIKDGFADVMMYQDEPIQVTNLAPVNFNRKAITNSNKHTLDVIKKMQNKQVLDNLSLELDLL